MDTKHMWCYVWCGLCVCVCCGACVCVVVWCVARLGTRKTPRVLIQQASVRTVSTPPCVPATRPHVEHMRARCRYTRRRADGTHGGVLNQHTGGFCLLSLSFFSLSFSSLFSLVSPLLSFVPSSSPLSFVASSSPLFPLFSSLSSLLSSLPFMTTNTVSRSSTRGASSLPLSATTAATSSSAIVGSVNRRQTKYPSRRLVNSAWFDG